MIQIATHPTFSNNYEEKHIHDAKYGWNRYDARFALPVYDGLEKIERYNVFKVRMLIRCAEDGKKYLYDIVNMSRKIEIQKSLDETQTLMDSLMQEYFG